MKPHVLCVGGEDHALRIPFLEALRRRGFQVSAAGTGDSAPFAAAGIDYRRYAFDRFSVALSDLAAARRLARLVRETAPDVVQTFDTKPGLLLPLATRGRVPVVRTVNGMGAVFSSATPRMLALRAVYCALQLAAARWTAATVFQNAEDREFFARRRLLGRSEATTICGSGIDLDGFGRALAAAAAGARALRERLGPPGAKFVLTVGRLTRQKGIPMLLDAATLVRRAHPEACFLLAGPREDEGPFAVDAAELERHAPHVTWLGPRRDVPALLTAADVFAFPSSYREGVPRVLLEAGLAGVPIVATRVPGCGELVTEGWNGHLTAPEDARSFAQRIGDLLDNGEYARAMGARSVAEVRRRFGLEMVADHYANVYLRAGRAGAHPRAPGMLRLRRHGGRTP
jgi:glycosyltransferase involved in cell wall biosynthesis